MLAHIRQQILSVIADFASAASGLGTVSASFFLWYQPEEPEHLKDV